MAKYWEGKYDINTNWGGDESTGNLPLPGSAVQDVIKTKLNELDKSKVGYMHENELEGKVYFYSTQDAYNNNEAPVGSVMSEARYSMSIKVDENNKYLFLSDDAKKEFTWYFKTIERGTNNTLGENVSVEYVIRNEAEGIDTLHSTIIECVQDPNNENYTKVTMNLDEYLGNGKSTIGITVRGLTSKQMNLLQTSFTIITLSLEDKTDFSTPVTNNFIVVADITCTNKQQYFLEYRLDNEEEFTVDMTVRQGIGRTEQINFYIPVANITDGRHVLEYRVYIKLDTDIEPYYTNTQRIEFIKGENLSFSEPQILIYSNYSNIETPETEDGDLIINGVSQYIPYALKYAIYNSEIAVTNVEFIEIVNGEEMAPVTNTIENNVIAEFDVQAMEAGKKYYKIVTKDNDKNITNGDGRNVYLNVEPSTLNIDVYNTNLRLDFSSVGKSNSSQDKKTWVSDVNGVFLNTASFNDDFDWSQGWTENGLVISDGCEVTFDYAPFPQQKSDATTAESNDFVGGDKAYTFEIEFMTQNVTDEDAIVCDMMDETVGGKCGLLITGTQIKFTTPNGESVSTRFKAEEMNRATIVVRPKRTSDGAFKGLVELYINGAISNVAKYTETEKFEVYGKNEIGNAISKNLAFKGTKGADIVVKYIRAYNGAMSDDNIVNNYIIYRTDAKQMLNLYNKNNVINDSGIITPQSMIEIGNIPVLVFVGRTDASELAYGDGNDGDGKGNCDEEYIAGTIGANEENWYQTLENTTNKKKNIDMDVIYYNPLDKSKNFKFIKAYITPQGTSSMYYPKKNYRIYTQKNKDTRCFFSNDSAGVLEFDDMMRWDFGEKEEDRRWEKWRGKENYKKRKYSFKDNAQPVKCWCLKADFAETSSSHNTGVARLWGDTLRNSTAEVKKDTFKPVFKTNAQATTETIYNNNINGDMPDVRTTIDGFPIVVFGKKSYSDEYVFLGKYNFNNDKSTESVFGFCDIDNETELTDQGRNTITDQVFGDVTTVTHTLDDMLDQYMSCVETLDNGNALANFSTIEDFDEKWEDAFEFRYPEIVEEPDPADYQDSNGNWTDKDGYDKDYADYLVDLEYWKNTHLKPFKHFAQWLIDTRWCDVDGNILPGISEEEAARRKEKFATEKWDHLDVWKMAAYYIYAMRFGAVDQIVKNSMLTSEGPFAYNKTGDKYGYWDTTDVENPEYGRYYKWYYINYDNDTVLGVKNDGSLAYGPEINRRMKEGSGDTASYIYAGSTSTLWNNFDQDEEFQEIVRVADQGISKTMTYAKAIDMFDEEQVGKWCERIYNKDADYKYISPYIADWKYEGSDEGVEAFVDKLFMLQGPRTAHRRWWMSKRFSLFDGKWNSGDFATKFVEVKCDYGSIGDTFKAVAGANAYFGYQINNKIFDVNEGEPSYMGGDTTEFSANDVIDWKLYKNIQIGDPIAIFGSTDMLELNLGGLSKNLSSVVFNFGTNKDISNKLEILDVSVPDEWLFSNAFYETYSDDEESTVNWKSGYDKIKLAYPDDISSEADFEDGGKYPTSDVDFDATASDSPAFYRIKVEDTYVYFAKKIGGIRNYSCKGISFDSLDKLQELRMAGYMNVPNINLSNNKFITNVDVRYSNISNITFAEGARIKKLSVSDQLTTLALTRCDNLTLNNIDINGTSLDKEGGKNFNVINIDNSVGLNHNNDFKTFMIKWMKGGYGYKSNPDRKLILKDIKWTEMSMSDIDVIYEFVNGEKETGKNKASECVLTGVIEMGNIQLMKSDLDLIEELKDIFDRKLDIRIPYASIILNSTVNEIVAGQSVSFDCTLFPNLETIIENRGVIEGVFVEEVKDGKGPYYDSRNNRYYKEIAVEDLRDGLSIKYDATLNKIVVSSVESNVGSDVDVIVMGKLSYEGGIKFDLVPLKIKDPTYAIDGFINGTTSLSERENSYTYNVSLVSNKNTEPIGTVDIIWELSGSGVQYIKSSAVTVDGRMLTIVTTEDEPELTDNLEIVAYINNYNSTDFPSFIRTKKVLVLNRNIILTNISNPTVMAICSGQGWTNSSIAMTKDEGAAVESIGTAFANINANDGWSFDEFKYFTNVNLNSLSDSAFENSNLTSIILPDNIQTIGKGAFANCNELVNVELNNSIAVIPESCFYNCHKLENLIIPDNVTRIEKYAFGGVGVEKILQKTTGYTGTNKAIYISELSLLNTIVNDAFEIEGWTPIKTTNVLNEIVFPNKFGLDRQRYNFLLSRNLSKISFIDEENPCLKYEDNILYASRGYDMIARAIPNVNKENIVDFIEFDATTEVLDYAFFNCKSVRAVKFGGAMREFGFGEGVFYDSSIVSVDLSECELLKELKEYTFYNCNDLENVDFPINGSLYMLSGKIFYNSPKLSTITLPDTIMLCKPSVEATNSGSFTIVNCGIKSFKYPENLTYSQMYLINSCPELENLEFSKYFLMTINETNTSYYFVSDLPKLKSIKLPLFSTTITENSYFIYRNGNIKSGPYTTLSEAESELNKYTEIEEIINPNNYQLVTFEVKSFVKDDILIVNENCFSRGVYEAFDRCPNIEEFLLNDIDNKRLMITDNNKAIYRVADIERVNEKKVLVERDSKILERVAPALSEYTILDDTSVISGAFANCVNIKNYVIPDSVIKINNSAFYKCKSLEKIELHDGLEIENTHAFYECSNLLSITFPESIKRIPQHTLYGCLNLARVEFLADDLEYIDWLALGACVNLSEIIVKNPIAPVLKTDITYSDEAGYSVPEGVKVYKFNPFGHDTYTFVGKEFAGEKILYVPYNHSGYDTERWITPLLNEKCSNFSMKYLPINDDVILRGTLIDGESILYLKSESGEFVNDGNVESTTKGEDGFLVQFDGKVYDNEKIYVYRDSDLSDLITIFVAKYNTSIYTLDAVMGLNRSSTPFSSGLFGATINESNEENVEMANITKLEYDILVSKVNQLMKLLKKKK